MGRYDGEEYEPVPPCRKDEHKPGMNGICHVCQRLVRPKLAGRNHVR